MYISPSTHTHQKASHTTCLPDWLPSTSYMHEYAKFAGRLSIKWMLKISWHWTLLSFESVCFIHFLVQVQFFFFHLLLLRSFGNSSNYSSQRRNGGAGSCMRCKLPLQTIKAYLYIRVIKVEATRFCWAVSDWCQTVITYIMPNYDSLLGSMNFFYY